MFTIFHKKHFYNKSLYDYCYESTMKSIQNIKNKKIFDSNKKYCMPFCNTISDMNPNPNNKIPYILVILSIPSIFYFYYRKRSNI